MIALSSVEEVSKRIAQQFDPERIVLFGSHAYGLPDEDSDVDLLVVLPFEGKGFRKALEIIRAVSPTFPIDLIARTPDDTARRYREGDPLIREALDRGRTLYERNR